MNADYVRTVQLLLAVAPAVFDTTAFAMKGGTALNLFVQDMPRLSVDIDVVFVPYGLPRQEALNAISAELAAAITPGHKVQGIGLCRLHGSQQRSAPGHGNRGRW